jgi:hypothetical protein
MRLPSLMTIMRLIIGSWKKGMHKNRATANMLVKAASHKTIQEEDWCLHRSVEVSSCSFTVQTRPFNLIA